MSTLKKGIQLYALRSLCSENLEEGLKTVAGIGYEGVEFAGFFGHTAEEVTGWLKEYHLEALGAHIGWQEIFEKPDETIAFHKAIGNHRIICPWYDMNSRKDVEELAAKMNAVAAQYKAAGMRLFYHNHAHEFEKDNGECLIDILAGLVSKDILSLEFDVYWVYRGHQSPLDYLKKYSDRVEIFHAKDGNMEDGTIAGEGDVPMPEVFAYAKEIGMEWAVVESEASEEKDEQIDAAAKDYAYISKLV